MKTVDVVVIGAGIAGTNIAYCLARRGLEVTLLEAAPFVGSSSSGVNAGTLSPQNHATSIAALCLSALELWAQRERDIPGGVGFVVSGGIKIAETRAQVDQLREDVRTRRAIGIPVDYVDRTELAKLAPYLSERVLGGIYCHLDGYAGALVATENTARAAVALGARLLCSCRVVRLEKTADGVFRSQTNDGMTVESRRLVISAGLWSARLGYELGAQFGLAVRINQMAVTEQAPPLVKHVVMHANRNLTVKQVSSGNVLIGGGWPGNGEPTSGRAAASYGSLLGNVRLAVDTIPQLAHTSVVRTWAGYDGRTPDQLPYLGPVRSVPGLYLATSCSGGFLLGPLTGEVIAGFIIDGRAPFPVNIVAPPC